MNTTIQKRVKKSADKVLKVGMIGLTNDVNNGNTYEIIKVISPRCVAVRAMHIGFSSETKSVVYVSDRTAGVFHVNFHASISQNLNGWYAGITKFEFHTMEKKG